MQEHHRCHFVCFVMYISGTKFEDHCYNMSKDILDSVFYHFGSTVYYVITFLISIIQKRRSPSGLPKTLISLECKKDISKRKATFSCILKSLSNNQQLFFHFIGTLRWPNTVFKSLCLILHNFLNYLCFGAHSLQELTPITEVFILAFLQGCMLLPWQRGLLKTSL